jgi:hypothetical protein
MVDLGVMPLANSYLRADQLEALEPVFPLRAVVCDACLLVQLDEQADPGAIFSDYAYFSSYSESWLCHARRYADDVVARFGLDARSQVVEVASNDGYLLQNFVVRGIPALGIEPAANVAAAAVAAGVPTRVTFFDTTSARALVADGIRADLLVANNVLAHVPGLNDFVEAFALLLASDGVATFEFPHLLRLMREGQFDTIYHEHFSYFSLIAASRVFERHGLAIFDVQELPTHGGSLRLFVQHRGGPHARTAAVDRVRQEEDAAGLRRPATYASFGATAARVRADLRAFLHEARRAGRRVAAYGAPAKGNTLLNYCGVGRGTIAFTVDRNPHKQGRYLPGTHLAILQPEALRAFRPDYVLLLPWNLQHEIVSQMAWIGEWGGQFVVPVPQLRVLSAHGQA